MVVIGLFTNPGKLHEPDFVNKELFQWIESSGATCRSIDYRSRALASELDAVDGLVMGGGAVESKDHSDEQREWLFQAYADAYSYANVINTLHHFPILGICLGCEMMILLKNRTRDFKLLDKVEVDEAKPISFVMDSPLKRGFDPRYLEKMAAVPCGVQQHHMGVLMGSPLHNSFDELYLFTLGYNDSPQGKYVSMVKDAGLPYYGIMWHPEKAKDVFSKVIALQLLNFLKLECRRKGVQNDSRSMLHVRKASRRQVPVLRKSGSRRKRGKRRGASRQVLHGRRVHEKDD